MDPTLASMNNFADYELKATFYLLQHPDDYVCPDHFMELTGVSTSGNNYIHFGCLRCGYREAWGPVVTAEYNKNK